jgi:hypothetical protein
MTMLLHLILGSAALMGGAFTGGLLLVVIGIRAGDRGRRLSGGPVGRAERFARRMLLTGSLRCDSRDDTEAGR